MTRIHSIDARAISIERTTTLTTAYGPRNDATTVLVQVRTESGIVGLGQAAVDQPYYGETAEGMLANIRTYLAPALVGEDAFDIERLNTVLSRTLPGHEASQSAIEMALWDVKGKALGVPVYQLLGGKVRPGIKIMGSLTHASPDVMAREAESILDETPYPIIKMKVGMDVEGDIQRYRAVREAIGDRARLQGDGNAGYTFGEALTSLSRLVEIGNLVMIDQPVARLDDLTELARRIPAPLMADESISGLQDALDIIVRRAASGGFLKVGKVGGILNTWKIGTLFEAAGMVISMGIYYDVIAAAAAHLAAALPAASWPAPFTNLQGTILSRPLVPEGLLLPVPEGPGLGVEIEPELVEQHALGI